MNFKHIKFWSIVLFLGVVSAAIIGILSIGGSPVEVTSIHGESFLLHGSGIYRFDTQSVAIQAISQDVVTILVWGSLFIVAWLKLKENSELSKLFFIGLLGYTLYAYMSYAFLSHFNELFLLYVWNMSLSGYLIIRTSITLKTDKIREIYKLPLPIRRTVVFLVLVGTMLALMWLARIIPALSPSMQPVGLETYHTLVIQVMDLGIIVPLSLFAAYKLAKRTVVGYILTSVLLFKGTALFTAVGTMAVVQGFLDETVRMTEVGIFLALTVAAGYITIIFFHRSVISKAIPNTTV